MNILALDLGTKCGYASGSRDTIKLKSGVWKLEPDRYSSAGMRFIKFRDLLWEHIFFEEIQQVVFEEVHNHRAVAAAQVYGGLMAIMQQVCIDRGVQYKGIGVGTIKKHATGNGSAKKPAMIQAANKFYPAINVLDDNHADALCLYHYAETNWPSI